MSAVPVELIAKREMSAEVPELTVEETQVLVDACIAAKDKAHAPYSNFRVGAALLTQNGTLYTGRDKRSTCIYMLII